MLRNLKMMIERLPLRGISVEHLEIIHNRAGSVVKDVGAGDLQKIAGGIPVHRVHSNYRLAAHAQNEGMTIGDLEPHSKLTKDVRAIAARIAEFEPGEARDKKRGILSWFS